MVGLEILARITSRCRGVKGMGCGVEPTSVSVLVCERI